MTSSAHIRRIRIPISAKERTKDDQFRKLTVPTYAYGKTVFAISNREIQFKRTCTYVYARTQINGHAATS